MKKYFYFYRTENLLNGNFYYGVHKTDDLEDGYLGSGTRIKYAIEKYGSENFKNEKLKFFKTYEDALKYESEIVNETLLADPSCYNLIKGGKGGWELTHNHSLRNEWCKKGGENGPFNKNTGTCFINIHTNETIKASSKKENEFLKHNENYVGITKGKIPVKDNKNNIFLVNLTDERYISKKLIPFFKNCKHSEKTKELMRNTHKKNGDQQGVKNSQYGTRWITNEIQSKKISKSDSIPDGWKLGRKIKIN